MNVKSKYKNLFGVLLIFIGAVFFSGKAVLVKLCYQYNVDAVTLLTLRMVFSLPFYIVILIVTNLKNEKQEISRKTWMEILFLGIIGYYGASYFDFSGLKYITAGLERLILFVYPTIVVIISAFLFKRPIRKKEILALIITYVGILVAVLHDVSFNQNNVLIGGLLIFGGAVTYAMYLVGSEKLIPVLGTVRFTAYAMIVSTVVVVIHYFTLESVFIFNLPKEVYYLSIIMAVFTTVIPSFFISEGIRLIGSGNAAIVGSVGPVSTIILAYIFLGEKITFYQLIGTALVLAGVMIVGAKDEFIEEKTKNLKSIFNKKS